MRTLPDHPGQRQDAFEVVGALYAQATSNDVGGARLVEMVEEFDLDNIESLSDEVCSRSERATREAIADLPDGVYENEIQADGFDEPIRLCVSIRVDGDEMWVAYDGTSPQSERGINVCPQLHRAYTTSGKGATGTEIPNMMVDSDHPGQSPRGQHPTRSTPLRSALGNRRPLFFRGVTTAPWKGDTGEGAARSGQSVEPRAPATERTASPLYVFFREEAWGAAQNGWDLGDSFRASHRRVPAEVIEASPVVMHKREFRPDSEGPGRHRGGFGQEMEIGVRGDSPWLLSAMYDRNEFPAQGMQGGSPGSPGAVRIVDGEALHPKRQQRIPAGGRILLDLPGGGVSAMLQEGVGKVRTDVEEGLVSRRARRAVILLPDAGSDGRAR